MKKIDCELSEFDDMPNSFPLFESLDIMHECTCQTEEFLLKYVKNELSLVTKNGLLEASIPSTGLLKDYEELGITDRLYDISKRREYGHKVYSYLQNLYLFVRDWLYETSPSLSGQIHDLHKKLVFCLRQYWVLSNFIDEYVSQLQDQISLLKFFENNDCLCKLKLESAKSTYDISSENYLEFLSQFFRKFYNMKGDKTNTVESLEKEIQNLKILRKRMIGFIVRSVCKLIVDEENDKQSVNKSDGCSNEQNMESSAGETKSTYGLHYANGKPFQLKNEYAVQIFDLVYYLGLVKDLKDPFDILSNDDKRIRVKDWLKATNDDKIDFNNLYKRMCTALGISVF